MSFNKRWSNDLPSERRPLTRHSIRRSYWSKVSRRCFLLVFLSLIFITGSMLMCTGDWQLEDESTTAYFRLNPTPRFSAELVQLLRRSVADSRGSWRCVDAVSNVEDDTGDGGHVCQPRKSTLATVSAAHPTVYSTTGVNCQAMFNGDEAVIQSARHYMEKNPDNSRGNQEQNIESLINGTYNCAEFRQRRGYFSEPLSPAEAEFPIAYSILVYDHVSQVERLLRAIYMPQNFYCIHVDTKADKKTVNGILALTSCFDNVFIPSQLESVYWGHISIVHAEMSCLRDLLRFQWKYFINLSGFMFPAHSNGDLVNILKLYDGANDIEGSRKRLNHLWMTPRVALHWRFWKTLGKSLPTFIPKMSPPYNVTIYKGSNQAALTREFVVYFMNSAVSHNLVKWFSDTLAPDEYIWPTLNHNPQLHAPGAYKGDPETKIFTARATIWLPIADQINWSWSPWPCHGQWVREICIFGVGDLPWLHRRPELFVNKFYADFEPLAYDCMEELIYNRTVLPFQIPMSGPSIVSKNEDMYKFNPAYYIRLPFVANKTSKVVSLDETLTFLEGAR